MMIINGDCCEQVLGDKEEMSKLRACIKLNTLRINPGSPGMRARATCAKTWQLLRSQMKNSPESFAELCGRRCTFEYREPSDKMKHRIHGMLINIAPNTTRATSGSNRTISVLSWHGIHLPSLSTNCSLHEPHNMESGLTLGPHLICRAMTSQPRQRTVAGGRHATTAADFSPEDQYPASGQARFPPGQIAFKGQEVQLGDPPNPHHLA